jgi:hypothetical protein
MVIPSDPRWKGEGEEAEDRGRKGQGEKKEREVNEGRKGERGKTGREREGGEERGVNVPVLNINQNSEEWTIVAVLQLILQPWNV